MADQGAITLPDDNKIPWTRMVISEEELQKKRGELAVQTVGVVITHKEYGQQLLTEYEVPVAWLDAFLFDFQDAPEQAGQEVLEIKPLT